jgi:hypothetical protein
VFAGGDVAYGPRNVIDAVANGKLAARSIDAHLNGKQHGSAYTLNVEKIPTRTYHRPDGYERIPGVLLHDRNREAHGHHGGGVRVRTR